MIIIIIIITANNTDDIVEYTETEHLKLHRHMKFMSSGRLAEEVFSWILTNITSKGRPRKGFYEEILKITVDGNLQNSVYTDIRKWTLEI